MIGEFLERAAPWWTTLVLHNWPVMVFTVLTIWAALRLYVRPSRTMVLVLYGALFLVGAYEYQKHGLPTAADTVNYLFSIERNLVARITSQWLLLQVMPLLLYGIGLALLALGALAHIRCAERHA